MQNYNFDDEYNALFYQMPQWLYKMEPYKSQLNGKHREAYMFLKNRLAYSIKNHWADEKGRVYFIYPDKELAEDLCCSERTVTSIKKKLVKMGLLIIKQQGYNAETLKKEPARLYLTKPDLPPTEVYRVDADFEEELPANFSKPEEIAVDPQSLDNSGQANFSHTQNRAQSQEGREPEKISVYNNKNSQDTKKIHEETQLDFSTTNFTPAEIRAQNRDLVQNASTFMTQGDNSENYILSPEATKVLSLWCRTPREMYRIVRVILNARDSVQKGLYKLNIWKKWRVKSALRLPGQFAEDGYEADDLEDYVQKTKQEITVTLRKVFNAIRRSFDYGKPVKDVESYIFIAFKRHFKQKAVQTLEGFVDNAFSFQKMTDWLEMDIKA